MNPMGLFKQFIDVNYSNEKIRGVTRFRTTFQPQYDGRFGKRVLRSKEKSISQVINQVIRFSLVCGPVEIKRWQIL